MFKVTNKEFHSFINKFDYEAKKNLKSLYEAGSMKYVNGDTEIASMDFATNLNEIQYHISEEPKKAF